MDPVSKYLDSIADALISILGRCNAQLNARGFESATKIDDLPHVIELLLSLIPEEPTTPEAPPTE